MTCRIDHDRIAQGVILRVSGRISGSDLGILRNVLEQSRVVAIDLAQIELVDRDAVMLLASAESNGIALTHCPAFIREWIARERGSR